MSKAISYHPPTMFKSECKQRIPRISGADLKLSFAWLSIEEELCRRYNIEFTLLTIAELQLVNKVWPGTESLSTLLLRQPMPNEIFREEDTSRHTHLHTGSLSFIEESSSPMGQRKETRGSSPLAKHKRANYSRMIVRKSGCWIFNLVIMWLRAEIRVWWSWSCPY